MAGNWKAMIAAAVLGAAAAPAWAQPTSPEAILEKFDATEIPRYDRSRRDDEAYVQAYKERRNAVIRDKCELIETFCEAAPDHERVPELTKQRWVWLAGAMRTPDAVIEETQRYLEANPETAFAIEAAWCRMFAIGWKYGSDADELLPAIDRFAAMAPGDERAVRFLMDVAQDGTDDPEQLLAIYQRVLRDYPHHSWAAYMPGKIRQIEGVGKPFELSFTDAISGRTVSMKDLVGKVVVIDFWATWCGPCVAEMPHMKELYATYKDKGVQFIGVSLDAPKENQGLEKLRTFVKENDIQWPQYYQGNGWDSEFSTSWGIDSIPTMFVVHKDGTLYSTSARDKLETIIPELLALEGPG